VGDEGALFGAAGCTGGRAGDPAAGAAVSRAAVGALADVAARRVSAGGVDAAGPVSSAAATPMTGVSVSGSEGGAVLRVACARVVVADAGARGFAAARFGLSGVSPAADGSGAARRAGGLASADVASGSGASMSVAGALRLRGVFGLSLFSIRRV
jgi:hypothetical protein